MKTVEKEQAKESLKEYVTQLKHDPTVITDHGIPIAALLPIENADLETVSLSTNPKFIALIERSRQRHSAEGGISSKKMRKRLKID